MKIDEILKEWQTDSKIDATALDTEALNIPLVHCKYLNLLSEARLKQRRHQTQN